MRDVILLTFVLVGVASLLVGFWPVTILCVLLFLVCKDVETSVGV